MKTEAQKKATAKYDKKAYDVITVRIKKSEELKKHIDMRFKTAVEDIIVEDNRVVGVELEKGDKLYGQDILLAPGRDGATWLDHILSQHGIKMYNNQVDIGVRVETSNVVMDEINETCMRVSLSIIHPLERK